MLYEMYDIDNSLIVSIFEVTYIWTYFFQNE